MVRTRSIICTTVVFAAASGLLLTQSAFSQPVDDDTKDSAYLMAPLPGMPDIIQAPAVPEAIQTDHTIEATIDLTNKCQERKANNLSPRMQIILHKVIPIILDNSINSMSVRIGEQVRARLKEDLYYGRFLVAPANSILIGHITSVRNGRTLGASLFQAEDKLKGDAAIEIYFDSLVTDKNFVLTLTGRPVHQESLRLGSDGFSYGITVDHQGKIVQGGRTLSRNQKNTYKTLRVAGLCPLPAGIFLNLTVAPVVMGAVGAASPEVAFNKPLDTSVSHKRLKGMAYGFITNLPGAFLVQAVVEKGNEIVLNRGDELMIDITINDQLHYPHSLAARPDTLNVKAELLTPAGVSMSQREKQDSSKPQNETAIY